MIMKKNVSVNKTIKEESDLLQLDVKKILVQLLNVSEENLFPIPEEKEVSIVILAMADF